MEFPAQDDTSIVSKMVVKGKRKKITWIRKWDQTDIFHLKALGTVHVLCLFAPFTFEWSALWLAITLSIVCGSFGITLSYHRHLTHKSFKLPKYLEYFFAYIGVHGLQGDPIWWVSTHRFHHKHTDTNRDPHTPDEGFWFSHVFWLFDNRYAMEKGATSAHASDLLEQTYYRFLQRTYTIHVLLQAALLYMCGGLPFVVWGMGVRGFWGLHVTWLVNSVCHTWGQRAWNTGDLSTNNWFIAMLTYGEGWHNNHHAFEYSARHGLEWWEIDVTWYFIKLLECLGLATDVKLPLESHMRKMSVKNV
ncbi:hypothetical protein ACHQM5_001823 [Ranunculus cassubicifolius]